ncbi:FKBP-type peptidyl-prolyl cis-trans isomerase [Candidatus Chromulinivorax destructor]|nr:FKBP-type peptidyl-prolyl cis-trans isomerase [Candidatus Chromulinivorax destructor]
MKKSILVLSTLFFLSALSPVLVQSGREAKLTKNDNKQPFTTGDKLNLNSATEFTQTNDGIYYKTIKSGTGKLPCKGEVLTVHYTGYFLVKKMNDKKQIEYSIGEVFDSSVQRQKPFSFRLGMRQVISGWDKMLATMKPGEKRIVVLPSKEAYGNRAQGHIPADASLIFIIEFISAA